MRFDHVKHQYSCHSVQDLLDLMCSTYIQDAKRIKSKHCSHKHRGWLMWNVWVKSKGGVAHYGIWFSCIAPECRSSQTNFLWAIFSIDSMATRVCLQHCREQQPCGSVLWKWGYLHWILRLNHCENMHHISCKHYREYEILWKKKCWNSHFAFLCRVFLISYHVYILMCGSCISFNIFLTRTGLSKLHLLISLLMKFYNFVKVSIILSELHPYLIAISAAQL